MDKSYSVVSCDTQHIPNSVIRWWFSVVFFSIAISSAKKMERKSSWFAFRTLKCYILQTGDFGRFDKHSLGAWHFCFASDSIPRRKLYTLNNLEDRRNQAETMHKNESCFNCFHTTDFSDAITFGNMNFWLTFNAHTHTFDLATFQPYIYISFLGAINSWNLIVCHKSTCQF